MIYIVYRTINLTNGKFYIGVHKSINEEFDGYYGSGHLIKRALKKYGKDCFKRNDLFVYKNPKEAFKEEKRLLEQWRDHPDCYNIAKGGYGGYTEYSPERGDKISKALTGLKRTPETCENLRQSKMGVYDEDKNPRARTWVITNPKGAEFKIKGNLHSFCKTHNLIFSCLYNNQGISVPPTGCSKSGGHYDKFGMFRERYPGHRTKRENTTGWKLEGERQ